MSSRVSSRLAVKAQAPSSDKENSSDQLSSPPSSPEPIREKVIARPTAPSKGSKLPNPAVRAKSKTDANFSTSRPNKKPKNTARFDGKDEVKHEGTTTPAVKGQNRKRASPAPKHETGDDELPHNLGKRPEAKVKVEEEVDKEPKHTSRKRRAPTSAQKQEQDQDAKEVIEEDAEGPPKKRPKKKANPYGLTPGETPFPGWPHPTEEECRTVHDLLMSTIPPERRKRFEPPDDIPAPSEVVAGCGEVPSILDALIRTLLSAATNGRNSSNSFQGLVQRFGLATVGLGKGSVNWNAVHEAPVEEVFEAIKSGGLAKNKSQNIRKILDIVHRENKERLAALLKAQKSGDFDHLDDDTKAEKELELHLLQQGALTLDYYHVLDKDCAITTFTTLPGIGVKTAACVNLFCMQRPCFAVDTHVFRLCQYLNWVPPDSTRGEKQKKADRNTTFSHCEVMIPDELKYGLHALFLEHGKHCPRCRAITGERSEGWADANCVIEHLVKRIGAKKGGLDSLKKKGKGSKGKGSEGEESGSEESVDEQTPRKSAVSSKAVPKRKGRSAAAAPKSTTPAKGAKVAKDVSSTKPRSTWATRATPTSRQKAAKGNKSASKVMESEEEADESMSEPSLAESDDDDA